MEDAGQKLKRARERLDLRYRDVEEARLRIAESRHNSEFRESPSARLAGNRKQGTLPSISVLFTLRIVPAGFCEVYEWYGVKIGDIPADAAELKSR